MPSDARELRGNPLSTGRTGKQDHTEDADCDVEEEREAGDPSVRLASHVSSEMWTSPPVRTRGSPVSYAPASPEVSVGGGGWLGPPPAPRTSARSPAAARVSRSSLSGPVATLLALA